MRAVQGSRGRLCFFLLLLIILFSACAVVRITRPVVKIGLAGPFEGPYRYVGYDAIYAVRLALRAVNAAGGVGGYSVELVAYDDQGTISGARAVARNLVLDPQVIAVIGHFGDETTAAARGIYAQANLPLIDSGTHAGWEQGEASLLCPLLEVLKSGEEAFELASQQSHMQWISADAGTTLPCAGGLSISVSKQVPPPTGVSAVLLTLDPEAAGETVVALRQMGWEGVIAGGPTLASPLFTQVAGAAASDVLFATSYRWPDIEGRDAGFSAAYQALGPHVPRPGPFALDAYQSTHMLLTAIEAVVEQGETPTRQNLAQNLNQPSNATVYVYRWTESDWPELVKAEIQN